MPVAAKAVVAESKMIANRGVYSKPGLIGRFGSNLKRNIRTSDILSGIGALESIDSSENLLAVTLRGRAEVALERGETNAEIAKANIKSTKRIYSAEAAKIQEAGRLLESKQLALFSKSGVDPGVGTPLMVMDESRMIAEVEAAAVRLAGAEAVENLRLRAALARLDAKQAQVEYDLQRKLGQISATNARNQIIIGGLTNIVLAGVTTPGKAE